jgi:pimeloyl-ACP methyl ester carboxylesterase
MEPATNKKSWLRQPKFILPLLAAIVFAIYITVLRPYLMLTMSTVTVELVFAAIIILPLTVSLIACLIILIITLIIYLWTHKRSRVTPWLLRLRLSSITTGLLAIALTIVTLGSQWLSYTPPILGEYGKPLAGSIATLEKVTVGDSQQWITIRGNNTNNPVLLFLAGGPGGTQLAASRSQLKELEKHFVVVNWDQPGSGKSYHAVSRESLTPERYVSDAFELTKYLCKRFNQEKLYVLGESWGSALGIMLVQKHPELFNAFMGTGQMVSFLDTEIYDYNLAIKLAEEKGDTQKVQELKLQGPPPYYGKDVTWKSAAYLMYLSNSMAKNPSISNPGYNTLEDLSGPEYGLYDKINYLRGVVYTFNHVYPQLYDDDLRKQAVKINIPVYFLEGRYDVNAPTEFAEEYFKLLESPKKEFIWFEHSGHSPWINERDKFVETVVSIAGK